MTKSTGLSGLDLSPPNSLSGGAPDWQLALSNILYDYWALPHTASATEGHSNLAITLSNMGYGSQQKASQYTLLNAKRLYHDISIVLSVQTGNTNHRSLFIPAQTFQFQHCFVHVLFGP